MTKTAAMLTLRRNYVLAGMRRRDSGSRCSPPHPAWLIAERLRAGAVPPLDLSLHGRFSSRPRSRVPASTAGPLAEKDPWGPGAPNARFGNSLQIARRAEGGYDMDYLECFDRKDVYGQGIPGEGDPFRAASNRIALQSPRLGLLLSPRTGVGCWR
jgi:hypothetical protein